MNPFNIFLFQHFFIVHLLLILIFFYIRLFQEAIEKSRASIDYGLDSTPTYCFMMKYYLLVVFCAYFFVFVWLFIALVCVFFHYLLVCLFVFVFVYFLSLLVSCSFCFLI